MAYDPVTNKWDLGLRARGIVLLGAGDPIVLCALDWIGIANEGMTSFAVRSPARRAHHLAAVAVQRYTSTTRQTAIFPRTDSQRGRTRRAPVRRTLSTPDHGGPCRRRPAKQIQPPARDSPRLGMRG